MKLRFEVKMFLLFVAMISLLIVLGKSISAMEQKAYNDAVVRCKGEQNVVQKYTSQGDKYWVCKK